MAERNNLKVHSHKFYMVKQNTKLTVTYTTSNNNSGKTGPCEFTVKEQALAIFYFNVLYPMNKDLSIS